MCDTGIFQIARHLLLNKNATVVINDSSWLCFAKPN